MIRAKADLRGFDAARIATILRDLSVRYSLPLRADGGLDMLIGIVRAGPAGLMVEAETSEDLHRLCEAMTEHLSALSPQAAANLRWQGIAVSKPPPHFRLARAEAVTALGRDFRRLRLRADDISLFAQTQMMHLRLILPVQSGAWPSVGANGRTLWPRGQIQRVITTRHADPATGLIELDIFCHPGGAASEFAHTAQPGLDVGLIGPAGDGLIRAAEWIIGGDETAFPSIARLIEAQAPESRGAVFLTARSGADSYPLPLRPGFVITYLPRRDDVAAALLAAIRETPGAQLWFAGEFGTAQNLRAALDGPSTVGPRPHIAAYWRQTARAF